MKKTIVFATLAASILSVMALAMASSQDTGLQDKHCYVDAEAYSTFTLTVDNSLDNESPVETRTIIVDAKTRKPVDVKVYCFGFIN